MEVHGPRPRFEATLRSGSRSAGDPLTGVGPSAPRRRPGRDVPAQVVLTGRRAALVGPHLPRIPSFIGGLGAGVHGIPGEPSGSLRGAQVQDASPDARLGARYALRAVRRWHCTGSPSVSLGDSSATPEGRKHRAAGRLRFIEMHHLGLLTARALQRHETRTEIGGSVSCWRPGLGVVVHPDHAAQILHGGTPLRRGIPAGPKPNACASNGTPARSPCIGGSAARLRPSPPRRRAGRDVPAQVVLPSRRPALVSPYLLRIPGFIGGHGAGVDGIPGDPAGALRGSHGGDGR